MARLGFTAIHDLKLYFALPGLEVWDLFVDGSNSTSIDIRDSLGVHNALDDRF